MGNNKSAVLFVLLLAFLFLLTAPIVLVIGHYFGILPQFLIDLFAKKVMLSHIVTAATAGLFLIPVLLIFLAAIIVAVKKRRLATPSASVAKVAVSRQAPARYPWESIFGAEEGREEKRHEERRRAVSKPSAANFKAAAAVVIVIALVVLVLLLANVIPAETPSNVTVEKQNVLSRILAQVFAAHNATNETKLKQVVVEKPADEVKPQQPQRNLSAVSLSAAAKKALGSIRSFVGKIKGKFVSSSSEAKSAVAKVPDAAWRNIAVAAVALLAVVTLFYSHRTSQLGEIPGWFRGWLGWLATILATARKNRLKVAIGIIFAAVVCAAIAAVVFRKWLGARFPSISLSNLMNAAVNVLFSVRDFVSVYRLYILIGIFALLAIIGILFMYETVGKKKENR